VGAKRRALVEIAVVVALTSKGEEEGVDYDEEAVKRGTAVTIAGGGAGTEEG